MLWNMADLPRYIHPDLLKWKGIEPPEKAHQDGVLGIYYNVLCPQERDADARRKLYAWINALDASKEFPLTDEELSLFSPATCSTIASKAFFGQLAKELSIHLEKEPFETALESALEKVSDTFAPAYLKMGSSITKKEKKETNPNLKSRYSMLAEAFETCGRNPQKALDYAIQKYQAVKEDRKQLTALLKGSMEKSKGQQLRSSDRWDHRKKSLFPLIQNTLLSFPHTPFFLALQEVTPLSLQDFKKAFSRQHMQWISYNNISGKETELMSPLEESIPGEAGSLTTTVGLSQELEIQRIERGVLPNCSGFPRTILGIEVVNQKTGGRFVIFSVHADYLAQKGLYHKTVQALKKFVEKFTQQGKLPFVIGGDFNAFERMGGAAYMEELRCLTPFNQAVDFREGDYYSPREIEDATFIGHAKDDYKMMFDMNGKVQPNALDHIFLTAPKILGFRKAGVYDEKGELIDPIQEPEKFRENLQLRNTASDHFMNGVLFVI